MENNPAPNQADERTARRKRFLINLLYWAAVLALLYGLLNYVIGWLLPFLIGFLIARILNPLIRLISRKTRIPRKPVAFLAVILFIGIIGTPLTFGGIYLFHSVQEQAEQFGDYYTNTIEPALRETERWITQNIGMLFPDWEVDGDGAHIIAWLAEGIARMVASINFVGLAAQAPTTFLLVLFTFLFTLFSTVYYEEALAFILRQMSEKRRLFISHTIVSLKRSLVSYYGAYLKIMAVTFAELLIGLSLIRGQFSLVPALAIALLDFLPVVGCGTVLIPWAVISLIIGNTTMGIGLFLLYIIIFTIRQLIEPKIVGDQLGLNPLLTLAAMYLGFLAMGVLGLIIMPIVVTVIADLQRKDKIHLVN
ncbi:MAG: sporulation integral membrane protein YtvI [Oscillospiraceae bacterium]|nr:sporulation integral membrane protein YtvI [Oscillospiraceae bacterium]